MLDATMQIYKDLSLLVALQAALAGHRESCVKKMNQSVGRSPTSNCCAAVVKHAARAFV